MRDPRVIALARSHIREEVGHAQMFRDCLLANGISSREIEAETPRTFTKAVFGYLTVTVQYESEYVTNVAIMQVMESVGFHFFSATLETMRAHGMFAEALAQHAEDDEEHSLLGLDLVEDFDDETMQSCERVVDDLYRLMGLMFEEWLGMGGLAPLRRAETLATQDSPSASLPA